MMFQSVGHRPAIDQRIQLAAQPDGKLIAVQQDYVNHTAMLDDYDEGCGEITPFLYSAPESSCDGRSGSPQRWMSDGDAWSRCRAGALCARIGGR